MTYKKVKIKKWTLSSSNITVDKGISGRQTDLLCDSVAEATTMMLCLTLAILLFNFTHGHGYTCKNCWQKSSGLFTASRLPNAWTHDASSLENCSGISDIKMLDKMARTVKFGGEDTSVRSLKIKDNTGSCKISLWRDLGQMKTPVGGHVEITNVIVQVYNEEKSVSTTPRTKLLVKSTYFIWTMYKNFIKKIYSHLNCCLLRTKLIYACLSLYFKLDQIY